MSAFRFLHAADIHLDSPLRGLAGHEREIAERVRRAPRAAFENLIARALDEPVDFVIIAGDLYDGSWKDYRTGLFFAEQMGKLRAADIPVFVLHGNHDAESVITRPLPLPKNVQVFDARKPETFTLGRIGAALHGQSFREKAVHANLVPDYPSPRPDSFNIGVLHTGLGGVDPEHDNYAPCSLLDLTSKGYDYWALGHIHRRQVLHERPWVVFPGNLQGRHVRETGPKGAFLVSVEDCEVESLEPVDFDVVRWLDLSIPAKGLDRVDQVVERAGSALEEAASESDGRLLACRIRVKGRCGAHGRLVRDPERFLNEVRAVALDVGQADVWVERVEVNTEPPRGAAAIRRRRDALGELQRFLDEAPADEELLTEIGKDVGRMADRLPPELRNAAGDPGLEAAIARDFAALAKRVAPLLVARLTVSEE